MPAPPRADQPSPPIAQDDVATDVIDATAVEPVEDAQPATEEVQPAAPVEEAQPADPPSFAPDIEPVVVDTSAMRPQPRGNLFQRIRDWLRRED